MAPDTVISSIYTLPYAQGGSSGAMTILQPMSWAWSPSRSGTEKATCTHSPSGKTAAGRSIRSPAMARGTKGVTVMAAGATWQLLSQQLTLCPGYTRGEKTGSYRSSLKSARIWQALKKRSAGAGDLPSISISRQPRPVCAPPDTQRSSWLALSDSSSPCVEPGNAKLKFSSPLGGAAIQAGTGSPRRRQAVSPSSLAKVGISSMFRYPDTLESTALSLMGLR